MQKWRSGRGFTLEETCRSLQRRGSGRCLADLSLVTFLATFEARGDDGCGGWV